MQYEFRVVEVVNGGGHHQWWIQWRSLAPSPTDGRQVACPWQTMQHVKVDAPEPGFFTLDAMREFAEKVP